MRSSNGMSNTQPAMEEQGNRPQEGGSNAAERPQPQHARIGQGQGYLHSSSQSSLNLTLDSSRDILERPSASNLRSAFRTTVSPNGIIRAVTPDMAEGRATGTAPLDTNVDYISRGLGSQQGSPRSIPGSVSRRQGMVFNDSFDEPFGSESSPLPPQQRLANASIRPRTRTIDAAMLAQRSIPPGFEHRHRVGSVSSSGSQPVADEQRSPPPALDISSHQSIPTSRTPESPIPTSAKEKKMSNRRLMKRQSSRPTSPLISPSASVDSLPIPVPTEDPNNLILLMKTLCGRMRGEIQYQGETEGPWHTGIAYIDDEKGSLMFDAGQNGPFHIPIVSNLRGCRVLPVEHPEEGKECLELVSTSPYVELLLCPIIPDELDLWLAALLSWQQLRPPGVKLSNGSPGSPTTPSRPDLRKHGKPAEVSKSTNIIKVGNVLLWDKGPASSPRSIVQRSSTRDVRSPVEAWRRVSCTLQENGDLKLLMENDVTVLSVIELSQLSRCAIQSLDRTVLNEDYCVAIFPIYASSSERLSIFRPVYLALESRVHFEVWFVLLRAFAVPDIYRLDNADQDKIAEVTDLEKEQMGKEQTGDVFRIERRIGVRVTEAKVKMKPAGVECPVPEKGSKVEQDPLVGNYLAEVIIDGEVRARTTTKMATKNPFWREDCEFGDLPATVQELSVLLKRVEGSADNSPSSQHHSSPALSKSGSTVEVVCGIVTIPLDKLERGKDHEEWLQIVDETQQVIGSMLVKVYHEEHVALLSAAYQPLSDLLHRLPTGLTTLISSSLPGQLRRVSEQFLNIFQASGTTSDWIMALVEDEIDGIGSKTSIKKYRFSSRLKSNESLESASERELIVRDIGKSLAGEANLLFRGNTLLTQSLEFHMRRLGQEYLEDTLRDKINEINELNPDCEVDPSKVHHAGGDLDQHWHRLLQVTTEVWQCIASSAEKIPPELRHILKYIRAVAEDRYGDFLRTVTYTSVSGFLFLRFICPAILSPKLFGLLRDHPRPRAQRTLTLIAKALQKMSNLSTFGKREEWMEPMNKFLTGQRQVFREYIDKVCGIPAERGLKALPASYSTPITILGRLGPTAKEGFPSLPYLIDQPRSYAGLVKLWVDYRPADIKNGQVDGELLVFNELCCGLQRSADACLERVQSFRAAEAAAHGSVDKLTESLEQASLIESLGLPYGGSTTMLVDPDAPPGSSGSDGGDDTGTTRRRSKEWRRGRDGSESNRKTSGLRHVSGTSSGGTLKGRNGKVGRTILSGIMRIGGRAESPDSKSQR